MRLIDWVVLLLFFAYTIWDGMRGNRKTRDVADLLLAGRKMPGWAIGISVLATQASAITFIGTTGQAYMHDMRFVQFYLGTPIAMVILCVTLVPYYYRSQAFTAYEILEKRFGLVTRLTTSAIFLLSRGLAMGITIAAPSYVLSLILGTSLSATILLIGLAATVYTMFGGISGVIRTDLKQMSLMLLGLIFCFVWILLRLPENVNFSDALHLAGSLGKLQTIDLEFALANKYNLWSGLIAGTFLMLSYFGSDQSQVQRYLTARSLGDARISLLLPAMVKIPIQFFILLLGALLYVFYLFGDRPVIFTPETYHQGTHIETESDPAQAFRKLQTEREAAAYSYLAAPGLQEKVNLRNLDNKATLLRRAELTRLRVETGYDRDDTNYVLPYFILKEMPPIILGLIIAAIFAAAFSSIDSILNSLTASTIMDWYQRLHRHKRSDAHYLYMARVATGFWGLVATGSAIAFGETESITELVNQIGSYFYGPIFGLFVLLWVRRANRRSALSGLLVGIAGVFILSLLHQEVNGENWAFYWEAPQGYQPTLEYLWLNPAGAVMTVCWGWAFGRGVGTG